MDCMTYLLFDLYGPMASWGDTAIGEERPSFNKPTRSALIGLLSAALGYSRDENEKIDNLRLSVLFGIKQYSSGELLRDFHTAQMPSRIKHTHPTRKKELEEDPLKLNTVLSRREYRTDSFCSIAVELTKSSFLNLETLKAALEEPKFVLFLGRKSCPIGLPLSPRIVQAAGFKQALDEDSGAIKHQTILKTLFKRGSNLNHIYYWEGSDTSGDLKAQFSNDVWDEVMCRKRWLFSSRREYQYLEE